MRHQKTRTVTVHGWQGEGRTLTEAKADAVAKIERAAAVPARCHVIGADGYVFIVASDHTTGTWYLMQTSTEKLSVNQSPCYSFGPDNEEKALLGARLHLAHLITDLSADFWQTLGKVGPVLVPFGIVCTEEHKRIVADYLSWLRWQYRYREARQQGAGDTGARNYAASWQAEIGASAVAA